jgi:CDP-diglyceride synthetase
MISKLKTDWGFVINLLCVGVLGCMMCYIAVYIDMQAKRIDYLEIENIKQREALHFLLPSTKEEASVGTAWHDKGH